MRIQINGVKKLNYDLFSECYPFSQENEAESWFQKSCLIFKAVHMDIRSQRGLHRYL